MIVLYQNLLEFNVFDTLNLIVTHLSFADDKDDFLLGRGGEV